MDQNLVRSSAHQRLHPFHLILLAFPVALFVSAVLSDIAYLRTAEIQWSNFTAWLIAGGLAVAVPLLIWAILLAVRAHAPARRRATVYVLLLAAMCVLALLNSMIHGRDAWYSVTATGLLLSVATALLALIAGWIGYSGFPRAEDGR